MSTFLITTLGVTRSVTLISRKDTSVTFEIEGVHYTVNVAQSSPYLKDSNSPSARAPTVKSSASTPKRGEILSSMPGVVTQILVAVGDSVKKGTPLIIIEAMKMENPVLATIDGKVHAIHIATGEEVAGHKILMTLK